MVKAGIAAVIRRAERHAVGGSRTDQRRAAHLHHAYGMGRVFQSDQAQHDRLARQPGLVENEDGIAILDERRVPLRHQFSLPWQCLYFFPLPQGQGSLRPTLGVWRSTGMACLGSAVAASASS